MLFCVPRRLFAGQQVFSSSIASFSATSSGWVVSCSVSSLYIFATIALSIAFLWVVRLGLFLAFIVLLTGIWLDQRVAVPFTVALRK